MKRRIKPKTLLLSTCSERSISRVMAALALTGTDVPNEWQLRKRAEALLEVLRRMT